MKALRTRKTTTGIAAIFGFVSIFYSFYTVASEPPTVEKKIELSQSYADRLNKKILHLSTQIVKFELTGKSEEKISELRAEVDQLTELQSDLMLEISQMQIDRNVASE